MTNPKAATTRVAIQATGEVKSVDPVPVAELGFAPPAVPAGVTVEGLKATAEIEGDMEGTSSLRAFVCTRSDGTRFIVGRARFEGHILGEGPGSMEYELHGDFDAGEVIGSEAMNFERGREGLAHVQGGTLVSRGYTEEGKILSRASGHVKVVEPGAAWIQG